LAPEYPHNSPYAFSENRLIDGVELEGLEVVPANEVWNRNQEGVTASGIPQASQGAPGLWGQIDGQNVRFREITTGPNAGNYEGTVFNTDGTYQHGAYVVGRDVVNTGSWYYGKLTSTASSETLDFVRAFNKSLNNQTFLNESNLTFKSQGSLWERLWDTGKMYGTFIDTYVTYKWSSGGDATYFMEYALRTEDITMPYQGGSGMLEFVSIGGAGRAIVAANGVRVTGFASHGVHRAIGSYERMGVKPQAILDALKNPLKINPVVYDDLGRASQRYIGRAGEVVLNPNTGVIISVNPTSSSKAARLINNLGR
jgi:hypothetical protein